jgi:bifunctional DNA-binding transcriptional regulator/antitoxin component of YhaV-PrlF toxin-antitoxin module
MPAPHSIKARVRQGTESLDLTIPAELKREHGITAGDVFIVEVQDGTDDLTISYERVHEAES